MCAGEANGREGEVQVKSILADWYTDLSRQSRKLRIRCFNRNRCNQTLGLRVLHCWMKGWGKGVRGVETGIGEKYQSKVSVAAA